MADVERIAPPVPTLPSPVGREVGSRRRQHPSREAPSRRPPADDAAKNDPPSEHIDEYV